MKRAITIACLVACASLAAAAVAIAGGSQDNPHAKSLAAKQCAQEKKADKGAFRANWGPHAMRNCIRGTTDDTATDLKNAAKECKAERQSDPATFQDTYGTGHNAFGKCVSTKVRQDRHDAVSEFKNAAQECRAERQGDPDGFRDHYGSIQSKGRNAFGKCVSQKVRHASNH